MLGRVFGAQVLAYRQRDYIDYFLRSVYPYVNLIQVMYSEVPWVAYNPEARKLFGGPDGTREILESFPDTDGKLEITYGEWKDQASMRSQAADRLRRRGADICLILDADEFWPDGMLGTLVNVLSTSLKNQQVAWCHYKTPFKSMTRVVDFPGARLPVAVDLRHAAVFSDLRIPLGDRIDMPNDLYYWHLGYVLNDDRMYEKVHTYGHSAELPDRWYEEKWLGFDEQTTNLCRKDPPRWPRTVTLDPWSLPSILYSHPFFPYGAESAT